MTTKHTPEKWKPIRDIGSGKINIWADDGNEWIGEVEDMRDARLIAAAPDLLAACEALVEAQRRADAGKHGGFGLYVDAVDIARAAIAKAKGKKP